jgi:hypothetical protein
LRRDLEAQPYGERSRTASVLGAALSATAHAPLIDALVALSESDNGTGDDDYVAARAALDLALAQRSERGVRLAVDTLYGAPQRVRFVTLAAKIAVQQCDDDALLALLLDEQRCVPHVRLRLVHACLAQRRSAVLDRAFGPLRALHGVDAAAEFLHGCSSGVVFAQLTDAAVRESFAVDFAALAHHHPAVVIRLIAHELDANGVANRERTWRDWHMLLMKCSFRLFNSAADVKAMWALFVRLPPYEWAQHGVAEPNQRPTDVAAYEAAPRNWRKATPTLISAHWPRFGRFAFDDVLEHIREFERLPAQSVALYRTPFAQPVVAQVFGAAPYDVTKWRAFCEDATPETRATIVGMLSLSDFVALEREELDSSIKKGALNFALADVAKAGEQLETVQQTAWSTWFSWMNAIFNHDRSRDRLVAARRAAKTEALRARVEKLGESLIIAAVTELLRPLRAAHESDASLLFGVSAAAPMFQLVASVFDAVTALLRSLADERWYSLFDAVLALVDPLMLTWYPRAAGADEAGLLHSHSEFVNRVEAVKSIAGTLFGVRDAIRVVSEAMQTEQRDVRRRATQLIATLSERRVSAALVLYAAMRKSASNADDVLLGLVVHQPTIEERAAVWARLPEKLQGFVERRIASCQRTLFRSLPMDRRLALLAASKKAGSINAFEELDLLEDISVSSDGVRDTLVKAGDSANVADRRTAIARLIKATLLDGSLAEWLKTVRFVRDKVKNETPAMRAGALAALTQQENALPHELFPEFGSDALFALYADFQRETFEAASSPESVASFAFISASAMKSGLLVFALGTARSDTAFAARGEALFLFGARLAHSSSTFERGAKNANDTFTLTTDHDVDTTLLARAYVDLHDKALRELLPEAVYAARKDALMESALDRLSPNLWHTVPRIVAWLEQLLVRVEAEALRDGDNLLIVNAQGRTARVFGALMTQHTTPAAGEPKARPDAAQRKPAPRNNFQRKPRRHADQSLFAFESAKGVAKFRRRDVLFLYHGGVDAVARKARLVNVARSDDVRDELERLFGAVPEPCGWSDIPVLRKYVEQTMRSRALSSVLHEWRADVLRQEVAKLGGKKHKAALVAAKTAATGRAALELLQITKSAIYQRWVWRYLLRARQDLLTPFLSSTSGATFRGVLFQAPTKRAFVKTEFVKVEREQSEAAEDKDLTGRSGLVAREAAADAEARAHQTPLGDHSDQFVLEACFDLRRLTPAQSRELALQWKKQLFNADRALPERVRSAIRFSLMPTTTVADIVALIDDRSGSGALSPALVDVLLRGLTQTNSPCNDALTYLFSPDVLARHANAAMAAVTACMPVLPSSGVLSIVSRVLGDEKMHRVTVRKQAVRLLFQQPTIGLPLILKEWARKQVHRDVRIAIVKTALLNIKRARFADKMWSILQAAAASQRCTELLIAIIGATNPSIAVQLPPLVERARLARFLSTLPKIVLPLSQRATYVTTVLLPLARRADVDQDVHNLALGVLAAWSKYLDASYATELLLAVVRSICAGGDAFAAALQRKTPNSKTTLVLARVLQASRSIIKLCGCTANQIDDLVPAPRSNVVAVMRALADASAATSSHTKRAKVREVVRQVLHTLPDTGVTSGLFSLQEEHAFVAPLWELIGPLGESEFLSDLRAREMKRLMSATSTPPTADAEALLKRAIVRHITLGPTHAPIQDACEVLRAVVRFEKLHAALCDQILWHALHRIDDPAAPKDCVFLLTAADVRSADIDLLRPACLKLLLLAVTQLSGFSATAKEWILAHFEQLASLVCGERGMLRELEYGAAVAVADAACTVGNQLYSFLRCYLTVFERTVYVTDKFGTKSRNVLDGRELSHFERLVKRVLAKALAVYAQAPAARFTSTQMRHTLAQTDDAKVALDLANGVVLLSWGQSAFLGMCGDSVLLDVIRLRLLTSDVDLEGLCQRCISASDDSELFRNRLLARCAFGDFVSPVAKVDEQLAQQTRVLVADRSADHDVLTRCKRLFAGICRSSASFLAGAVGHWIWQQLFVEALSDGRDIEFAGHSVANANAASQYCATEPRYTPLAVILKAVWMQSVHAMSVTSLLGCANWLLESDASQSIGVARFRAGMALEIARHLVGKRDTITKKLPSGVEELFAEQLHKHPWVTIRAQAIQALRPKRADGADDSDSDEEPANSYGSGNRGRDDDDDDDDDEDNEDDDDDDDEEPVEED